MKTRNFKVRISNKGVENIIDGFDNPWVAVGFAEGYVRALEERGVQFRVNQWPEFDFHWWDSDSDGIKIRILTPEGNIWDKNYRRP